MTVCKTIFPTLALASVAVVLALTGGAQAQVHTITDLNCINPAGCVDGSDIKNGTIGPIDIIPGSINATTIANGSIGPNKLIPGSINTVTIATDAIRSNKILDGAVRSADIRDNDVSGVDIRDGSLTGSDIAQNNSLFAGHLGTSSVGTSEVANNSLFDVDLRDEAGADGAFTSGGIALLSTAVTVQTVFLTAPTSGTVIVNAAGTVTGQLGTNNRLNCSLTRNSTALEGSDRMFHDFNEAQNGFAMTEIFFSVPTGTSTYRLVCQEFVGQITVFARHLNALFVPTRY